MQQHQLSRRIIIQALALSPVVAAPGGLSPLFQIGGPRSIQMALKLQF